MVRTNTPHTHPIEIAYYLVKHVEKKRKQTTVCFAHQSECHVAVFIRFVLANRNPFKCDESASERVIRVSATRVYLRHSGKSEIHV